MRMEDFNIEVIPGIRPLSRKLTVRVTHKKVSFKFVKVVSSRWDVGDAVREAVEVFKKKK